ncbi:NCS2 family permease [Anaerotignum propionicum]|uniref:Adenine permease AdeQ n=1 Tax=Anaerotignum propionicum DSM 1682 TaxID=991789 RepID=A0A0X1U7N7_ANAPI|nr:NCS2 family permease [Anaerotignum propionicum]AMJ40942.1 adenine permease AdeQ [Anaerotignum propionicum DSM 1682]SHE59384.1 putative MFS transporter, AGZA family, xanthine/uracil permease [[Clostridium] propionicum DSM 1682] [Anaerotignum propionicum DSM 1682]
MGFFEKCFKLKQNNTTMKTEIFAGLTTFMTMAYILVVNPSILSASGMDANALLTATCLASALGTFFMAFFANYPFALAPGMGLNAYFAFTVCGQYGYSWQVALTAVFVEGIIFILLSAVKVREAIFNAIPSNMKKATSVGIGMFIAFIGLQNAGVIVPNSTVCVALGDIKNISVALSLIGTIITLALVVKKVKGALFLGIILTWVLGIICQLTGIYVVDIDAGMYSLIPQGIISAPPSIEPIAMKLSFQGVNILDFITVVFAFLFVDLFDTLGTLIGVSTKAGFVDKDGKLPHIKGALFADACATTIGATLGTSTVTTFVESASGVSDGGRTGMTAFTTGVLFLIALLFSPILTTIPSFATTPALVVVGLFMVENIREIDFSDYTEGFPAFMTILMMVVAYSISEGLVFGVISYVLLKLLSGRQKELNPVIVIIGILFFIKLILG